MSEQDTPQFEIDTATLITLGVRGAASVGVARFVVKPFLEDLTGRKIRFFPLWVTTDLLWNALLTVPSYRARQLRREERDNDLLEAELFDMGVPPRD